MFCASFYDIHLQITDCDLVIIHGATCEALNKIMQLGVTV